MAMTEAEQRALQLLVPPRAGESKEAWLVRATSTPGVTIVGAEPVDTIAPYTGGPRADAPITYGNGGTLVAMQQNGGSAAALQGGGGVKEALIAMGIPAAIVSVLPAGALATLASLYGISQAIGVQYPWETGPGEGFIAPWSRDLVKDEAGRWVSRETRPDLFGNGALAGGNGLATVQVQGQLVGGRSVVKRWDTGYTDASGVRHPGWPFFMTSDADGKHKRIHTWTKDGVPVSYRPYKSVVLGKSMKQGMALRAVRKLQGIKDIAYAIEDLAGKGMKHTVKRSKKKG